MKTIHYSLACLFALYSLYKSDLFAGAACCSGSLWLPGWEEYAKEHTLVNESIVYLSLGGKEEHSKNPVIATIGEKTRFQDKLLDNDSKVTAHKLEMNPGGHFSDPEGRLAKGIVWLLEYDAQRTKCF